MSNGLLYIAGLVALALAALFAVPYFIDWNGYRGVFEEEATRILGREVRVGGNVNVRLLPQPYVRFEKLRIADTSGIVGEPFFRADSFTMRLSIPPLLKGVIEANEVEINRPVLRLALDASGTGNWRTLSIAPGALPFVPSDVALRSVKIKDGLLTVQGPKGNTFAELDGLFGELKADSIEGPFAFRGTTKWQGGEREVRFATDAIDAEGAVRFKAMVRGAKQDNSYTVEGRLSDLKGSPRVTGQMTAKLALDKDTVHQGQHGEKAPADAAQSPAIDSPAIDFRSGFTGDAKNLRFEGMTLQFERVGQPQLISGSAAASWTDALEVSLDLSSRWLDLDQVAGGAPSDRPFTTARDFVAAIMQSLPTDAETKVRFDLDQATLGGEAVSGVRVEVARSKGALLLKELRAGLPGGAKLALYGTVGEAADAGAFQGELALRGSSLARFLTWAAKDESVADALRSEGPFALQGRFAMSAEAIDLTEAGAEIGGTPLTGEVHYRGGERTRLSVVLQGQDIDAGKLWPAGVGYLKGLLAGEAEVAADTDTGQSEGTPKRPQWFDTASSDLSLRLRAGRVATGLQPLRDVDLDVALERGKLTVRSCRFSADNGLSFDLDGGIAEVEGGRRGSLHWVLAAPDKDAFNAFLRLWGLPADVAQQAARYDRLAPMRLAGNIHLGDRGKSAADIAADGSIKGGRMTASARLDGGLAGWRTAPADITFAIDSADVVQTFNALSAGANSPAIEGRDRNGQVFVKAVGVPDKALLTTAVVKASGLYFAYDGNVALLGGGNHNFNGDVRVSARELGDVMAIAGLGNGSAPRGVPMIGAAKMASSNHTIELRPQQLTVGESSVTGSLALAYPADGPAIVTAELHVNSATIPGLLGAVLDRGATAAVPPQQPPPAPAKSVADTPSIWPESPFDFAALDGLEGKLGVSFDSLSLAEGMPIGRAQLDVAFTPGKVTVTKLAGDALGGKLAATAALERVPGGASLTGNLQIAGAHLTPPGAAAKDAGKSGEGAATLALDFASRGATPGGLIAVASGSGAIELGDISMHVPTPLAVVATSEAVLSGHAGGSGDELVAALQAKVADSDVKVGPRKIALTIADGAAKLDAFTLPSPAGVTTVTTTVDLASLMIDSSWLLEPKAPDVEQPDKPRKGALPSVSFIYVGPLRDAWRLEPRVTADQLERELAVRKLELDADQLERLHKADVERAQREEERRRSLETDSAPAQQGAPGTPAANGISDGTTGATPAGPGEGAMAPRPDAARPAVASPSATVGAPQAAVPLEPAPVTATPLAPAVPGETAPTLDQVPALPGAEAQSIPQQPESAAAPTLPATVAGQQPPPDAAAKSVPQRRVQRKQNSVGDQVLRALQNW